MYSTALAVVHQRLLDPRQLEDEYRSVLERDRSIGHSVRDSQAPDSVPRNRYGNVLPYDYNRVKLGAGAVDYMNASTVRYADEQGPQAINLNYIAMQVCIVPPRAPPLQATL